MVMDIINQQRQLQRQEEAYSNFINSINSEETRREYHTKLFILYEILSKDNTPGYVTCTGS